MTTTSDFWLGLHELGTALESPAQGKFDEDTLAALQEDFERMPLATQYELRREMQNVIVGLARLDAHLSLDSLTGACLGR
jgi:hypothetical protein